MRNNFKSILIGVAFIAVALVGYKAYDRATMTEEELMFEANLEALTTNPENNPTLVPDRYLVVVPYVTNVVCNTNGTITVAGEKLKGDYERGKSYSVLYEIKNCDGVQVGAFCDQTKVGITIVK